MSTFECSKALILYNFPNESPNYSIKKIKKFLAEFGRFLRNLQYCRYNPSNFDIAFYCKKHYILPTPLGATNIRTLTTAYHGLPHTSAEALTLSALGRLI